MPSATGLSTLTPVVNDADTDVEETVDIFGSLSIGEDGYPVFHGATSMSEVSRNMISFSIISAFISTTPNSILYRCVYTSSGGMIN